MQSLSRTTWSRKAQSWCSTWQNRRTERVPRSLECVEDMLQESWLSRWTFYRYSSGRTESCNAVWVSRGSCKRWRERSIWECVRKYRGDARRVQTKGWLHEFRLPVDQWPTGHEARCRQKQLTSCKTEESLDDSALGGTYAREAEWEQQVLSRQSR